MNSTRTATWMRLGALAAFGAALAALATLCFRLYDERDAARLDAALHDSLRSTVTLELRITERIIRALETDVAAVSNLAAEAAAQLAQEQGTHAPLRAQIEHMIAEEIRLNNLVRDLSANRANSADALTAVERQFSKAAADLQAEKARSDALAKQGAAESARAADFETKFSQSRARADEATAQLRAAQTRVKAGEARLATARARIKTVEADLAAARQRVSASAKSPAPAQTTP